MGGAPASQPEWVRDYIADDWQTTTASTSSRHRAMADHGDVAVREYNVHPGGRAFDTITVTGSRQPW